MFNRNLVFLGGGAFLFVLASLANIKEKYDMSDPQEWLYLGAYLLPSIVAGLFGGWLVMKMIDKD